MRDVLMERAVIFDLDGTLVDSVPDLVGALNSVLENTDRRPVSIHEGTQMVGGGAESLIDQAFALTGPAVAGDVLAGHLANFMEHYRTRPGRDTTIFDGVLPVLDTLAADGVKLGICTNKPHEMTLAVLDALSIGHYFNACLGTDILPYHKPDRRHYEEVARLLGVSPKHTVYVGDSETDVATARNAGVPIVVVSFGYSRKPAAELGGDKLIGHFSELPGELDDLFAQIAHTS
jgi:phosphoglycolate phosphatase